MRLSTFTCAMLAVPLVLFAACGGDDDDDDGSAGSAGSSGSGGSNTGGSNTGGSNTGGSNTGGSNTGGKSGSGGGGSGGTSASGGTSGGGTGGSATGGNNQGGGGPGGDDCADAVDGMPCDGNAGPGGCTNTGGETCFCFGEEWNCIGAPGGAGEGPGVGTCPDGAMTGDDCTDSCMLPDFGGFCACNDGSLMCFGGGR